MTKKTNRKAALAKFAELFLTGLAGYGSARAAGAAVSMRRGRAQQIAGASSTPVPAIVQALPPAAPSGGVPVEIVDAELLDAEPARPSRKRARRTSR